MPYAECSECNRGMGSDQNECQTIHRAETNSRIAPLCCDCAQSAKSKNRFKGSSLLDRWSWASSACQTCKKRRLNKCKGVYRKKTLSALCVCGLTERDHDLMQFENGLNSVVKIAATAGELAHAQQQQQQAQHQQHQQQQPRADRILSPTLSPPPRTPSATHRTRNSTPGAGQHPTKEEISVASSFDFVEVPLGDPAEAVKESKALAHSILKKKVSEEISTQNVNVTSLEQIIEHQKHYIDELERERAELEQKVFRSSKNQQSEQQNTAAMALLEEENAVLQRRCTELQKSRSTMETRLMQERKAKEEASARCKAVEQHMESSVQHVVNVVSQEKNHLKEKLAGQQRAYVEDRNMWMSKIQELEHAAAIKEQERAWLRGNSEAVNRTLQDAQGNSALAIEEMRMEETSSGREQNTSAHFEATLRRGLEKAKHREHALSEIDRQCEAAMQLVFRTRPDEVGSPVGTHGGEQRESLRDSFTSGSSSPEKSMWSMQKGGIRVLRPKPVVDVSEPKHSLISQQVTAASSPRGEGQGTGAGAGAGAGAGEEEGSGEIEIEARHLTEERKIAEGSFGVVYAAHWLQAPVAVKKVRTPGSGLSHQEAEAVLADYRREVLRLKELRHPNVLSFFGTVTDGDWMGMVTELMDGDMRGYLRGEGRTDSLARRLGLLREAGSGLLYLHSQRVVHRDVKPENFLLQGQGEKAVVKVCDFGLARIKEANHVQTRRTGGTLNYIAPEVHRGEAFDERSDVYSFTIMLWELVTLQTPFADKAVQSIPGIVGWGQERPPIQALVEVLRGTEPKLRAEVRGLVEQGWHAEPEHRPPMSALVAGLDRALLILKQTPRSNGAPSLRTAATLAPSELTVGAATATPPAGSRDTRTPLPGHFGVAGAPLTLPQEQRPQTPDGEEAASECELVIAELQLDDDDHEVAAAPEDAAAASAEASPQLAAASHRLGSSPLRPHSSLHAIDAPPSPAHPASTSGSLSHPPRTPSPSRGAWAYSEPSPASAAESEQLSGLQYAGGAGGAASSSSPRGSLPQSLDGGVSFGQGADARADAAWPAQQPRVISPPPGAARAAEWGLDDGDIVL